MKQKNYKKKLTFIDVPGTCRFAVFILLGKPSATTQPSLQQSSRGPVPQVPQELNSN